jgi:hypothetical protein
MQYSDSSSLRFMRMNSTWLCLDLLPVGRSDALYFHTIILSPPSPPYIRHKISGKDFSQISAIELSLTILM